MFNDSDKIAIVVSNDPAQPGRVVFSQRAQQERGPVRFEMPDQRGQTLRLNQGRITGDDERQPLVTLEVFGAHLDGVTGAELFGLDGVDNIVLAAGVEFFSNLIGFIPDDDDFFADPGVIDRVEDEVDHRSIDDATQHFGQIAVHASAFAGREYDDHRIERRIGIRGHAAGTEFFEAAGGANDSQDVGGYVER